MLDLDIMDLKGELAAMVLVYKEDWSKDLRALLGVMKLSVIC